MSQTTFEFPGFQVPDSPHFTRADGTSMFAGEFPDPLAVLDLAMVFGSRLWGHGEDIVLDGDRTAPGVGDLYTTQLREQACEALARRVAGELGERGDAFRTLILHTGSEAVETALKTALRANERTKIVTFEGAYHGTFGMALAVTHRPDFREPWEAQLPDTVSWSPWGDVPTLDDDVACVIVEPWQGRAGVLEPPAGFHAALREECDRVGALLVLDAVLCGAGRTGATVAACIGESRPDIICLGKAIGCGATASAVVARTQVASLAWDRGGGEPPHTSTSLGEPTACAGIIRALDRLSDRADLIEDACAAWSDLLHAHAEELELDVRGTGLVWCLDMGEEHAGVELARTLLFEHRILVVPSGSTGSAITIYPAAITTSGEHERFIAAMRAVRSAG